LYLDALGKPPSGLLAGNVMAWPGSYSECTKMIVGAHYCLASINVPIKLNIGIAADKESVDIAWGICAPKQCSEQDMTKLLEELFSVLNRTGIRVKLKPKYPYPDAKAVNCNKRSEYKIGVIITLSLCGLIVFLCLVGTLMDLIISFTTPHSSPVNKSKGFMPIRNGSIATDHQETPHVPNPNGNANHDSFGTTQHTTDDTPAIQPSPEENVTGGPTLPSYHQKKTKPHVVIRFFLCFSLIQNTNRIMDTQVPRGAITSVNGMRVLSMFWVILGHTHLQFSQTCFANAAIGIPAAKQKFPFQVVNNASLAVDCFFFLSGLLVAYVSFRHMEKKRGQLPLFKYYFHRFWRLTPTYMFVLLFYMKLRGFLGEGPMWFTWQSTTLCDKYWWTNLLYINNFYPKDWNDMCMQWGWYLANDMQFYVIAPIILFTAYRFRLRGLIASVGSLMSASFITTAVIYYYYNHAPGKPAGSGSIHDDTSSMSYDKPYCRIAPYLVGMTLGFLLLYTRDWKMSKVPSYLFNVAGWIVAIALALSTLYGPFKTVRKNNQQPFTRVEDTMYGTFARFSLSLALAWVIFACHRGLGGLVDKILSARFWMPLSRLTYCAYLVHLIALGALVRSYKTANTYDDVHMAFIYGGVVVISYAAAFIVSVCVEFPVMQLEKLLFKSEG